MPLSAVGGPMKLRGVLSDYIYAQSIVRMSMGVAIHMMSLYTLMLYYQINALNSHK